MSVSVCSGMLECSSLQHLQPLRHVSCAPLRAAHVSLPETTAGDTNFPSKPATPTLTSGKGSLGVQFACPDAGWATTDSWTYTLTRVDKTTSELLSSVPVDPTRNDATDACSFTINPLPGGLTQGQFTIKLVSAGGTAVLLGGPTCGVFAPSCRPRR